MEEIPEKNSYFRPGPSEKHGSATTANKTAIDASSTEMVGDAKKWGVFCHSANEVTLFGKGD